MNTVVARFHHLSRDLEQLESKLVEAGADDARITGYTVALTFGSGSEESALDRARGVLDRIGATGIKIRRPKPRPPHKGLDAETATREEREAAGEIANLMAKIEMGTFGHP